MRTLGRGVKNALFRESSRLLTLRHGCRRMLTLARFPAHRHPSNTAHAVATKSLWHSPPNLQLPVLASCKCAAHSCEVFVSHRGPEAKWQLVSHIVEGLRTAKVQVFVDYALEKGEPAWDTITANLREAKYVLLVLTPGFESSCWCLEEARLMVEHRKSILPIFYGREPGCWNKDHLKNSLEAFRKYKSADTMERWRSALRSISGIAGWVFNSKMMGYAFNFATNLAALQSLC